MQTLKILLTYRYKNRLLIDQMYIETTFLNEDVKMYLKIQIRKKQAKAKI